MDKIYIGLDQSLTNTGVAYVCSDDNFKTIKYFTITTTSKDYIHDRYMYIIQEINKIFDGYKLEFVFLEETYISRMTSSKDLIKLEAVLQFYFHSNNYIFYSMSPRLKVINSWPGILNSLGTKDKFLSLIIKYLKEPINEHEVDAIGILLAGLKYKGVINKDFSKFSFINVNRKPTTPRVRAKRTKSSRTKRTKTD